MLQGQIKQGAPIYTGQAPRFLAKWQNINCQKGAMMRPYVFRLSLIQCD